MSILKKGSKKITVNNIDYRWRVSINRKITNWKSELKILTEESLVFANRLGIGENSDTLYNIPIELYNNPKSKIILRVFCLAIDHFLVHQQIKPKLIAFVIKESLNNNWNPHIKGDYIVEVFDNFEFQNRDNHPIIVLPNKTGMKDYTNLIKSIQIK